MFGEKQVQFVDFKCKGKLTLKGTRDSVIAMMYMTVNISVAHAATFPPCSFNCAMFARVYVARMMIVDCSPKGRNQFVKISTATLNEMRDFPCSVNRNYM